MSEHPDTLECVFCQEDIDTIKSQLVQAESERDLESGTRKQHESKIIGLEEDIKDLQDLVIKTESERDEWMRKFRTLKSNPSSRLVPSISNFQQRDALSEQKTSNLPSNIESLKRELAQKNEQHANDIRQAEQAYLNLQMELQIAQGGESQKQNVINYTHQEAARLVQFGEERFKSVTDGYDLQLLALREQLANKPSQSAYHDLDVKLTQAQSYLQSLNKDHLALKNESAATIQGLHAKAKKLEQENRELNQAAENFFIPPVETSPEFIALSNKNKELSEEKGKLSEALKEAFSNQNEPCSACKELEIRVSRIAEDKTSSEAEFKTRVNTLRSRIGEKNDEARKNLGKLRQELLGENRRLAKESDGYKQQTEEQTRRIVALKDQNATLEQDNQYYDYNFRKLDASEQATKAALTREQAEHQTSLTKLNRYRRVIKDQSWELENLKTSRFCGPSADYEMKGKFQCLKDIITVGTLWVGLLIQVLAMISLLVYLPLNSCMTYKDSWTQWQSAADRKRYSKKKATKGNVAGVDGNEPDKTVDNGAGKDDEKDRDEQNPHREPEPQDESPSPEPEPEPTEEDDAPEFTKNSTHSSLLSMKWLAFVCCILAPLSNAILVFFVYSAQSQEHQSVGTAPSTWYDPSAQSLALLETYCPASKLYSTGISSCFEITDSTFGLPPLFVTISNDTTTSSASSLKNKERPKALDSRTIFDLVALSAITIGAGYFAYKAVLTL